MAKAPTKPGTKSKAVNTITKTIVTRPPLPKGSKTTQFSPKKLFTKGAAGKSQPAKTKIVVKLGLAKTPPGPGGLIPKKMVVAKGTTAKKVAASNPYAALQFDNSGFCGWETKRKTQDAALLGALLRYVAVCAQRGHVPAEEPGWKSTGKSGNGAFAKATATDETSYYGMASGSKSKALAEAAAKKDATTALQKAKKTLNGCKVLVSW